MQRDLHALSGREFDLLVVGGGIHGAAICWKAAQAGLKTALIEKGDFAQGTSSRSQKIVHGGFRYLQQANFPRILHSVAARKDLLRLAPHLVRPFPCVMPLYQGIGEGLKRRESVWAALKLYDLIAWNRNSGMDSAHAIPGGSLLSREEILAAIPGLDRSRLAGGARWYDAFCANPERLVIAFLRSACEAGAVAANYVAATAFTSANGKVTGVRAIDGLTGGLSDATTGALTSGALTGDLAGPGFEIRARRVLNCAGPWIGSLDPAPTGGPGSENLLAKGVGLVVRKLLPTDAGAGIPCRQSSRLYFVAPWRGLSLVGTEYFPHVGPPGSSRPSLEECRRLLDRFNTAYPAARLVPEDIVYAHAGYLPRHPGQGPEVSLKQEYELRRHGDRGLEGLFSLSGVKFTTATVLADSLLRSIFPATPWARTDGLPPLAGGGMESGYAGSRDLFRSGWLTRLGEDEAARLFDNYGNEAETVLRLGLADGDPDPGGMPEAILRGETLFAVREEMALKVQDVLLRRTERGVVGRPSRQQIALVAGIMARELAWPGDRERAETEEMAAESARTPWQPAGD